MITPARRAGVTSGSSDFARFAHFHVAGNTWRAFNAGLWNTNVLALAIDPLTPSTLYAGTGNYGGVFKSTDAGATWGAANTGLTNTSVPALAIDPITPNTLYAGTGGGVFKSTDAGATWRASRLTDIPIGALAIDPITPSTLYAGTFGAGVFKSTDGGGTWRAFNAGLWNTNVLALAIDPLTPSTLYAGAGGGVFKSTDAGATWGSANTGLTGVAYANALAIDPITPSTLYAGGGCDEELGACSDLFFKSTDAGATWGATGLTNTYVTALAINPHMPSTLYAGTDDGVLKSTDAGATWGAASTGLTNSSVLALAIDPSTPSRLYAGTNGGGVFSIQQVAGCIGDCRGDGTVTVDDLVTGISIALGTRPLAACPSFDAGDEGRVTVDELIAAVNNTLEACPTDLTDLSGTLLVTDERANKVYMLDAASGDILASADTGEHPIGVEKANGKVYVANETADTISVYDSPTLSPRMVIPACEKPHHTAASPDGTRFYAACVGTNKVAVVDTETDTLVGLLTSGAPGARTHMPWPTKDGKRLWVTNLEINDITEIDLETGAILRSIPLEVTASEVVVSADAKTAYVSQTALNTIAVFDLETNQLVAEPTMLAPENIMLSGDGTTILARPAVIHDPNLALILDTETLASVEVPIPDCSAGTSTLRHAPSSASYRSWAGRKAVSPWWTSKRRRSTPSTRYPVAFSSTRCGTRPVLPELEPGAKQRCAAPAASSRHCSPRRRDRCAASVRRRPRTSSLSSPGSTTSSSAPPRRAGSGARTSSPSPTPTISPGRRPSCWPERVVGARLARLRNKVVRAYGQRCYLAGSSGSPCDRARRDRHLARVRAAAGSRIEHVCGPAFDTLGLVPLTASPTLTGRIDALMGVVVGRARHLAQRSTHRSTSGRRGSSAPPRWASARSIWSTRCG